MKHEVKEIDYTVLHISSEAFPERGMIPEKYTCDGLNINPPVTIDNIPEGTKSLAVIVDDPDAPVATWSHWLVWNIPVTHHLKENHVPGIVGLNDFQQHHYGGPCPPSGMHRYFFKVYALDSLLNLPLSTKKIELERAMCEHIIGFGEIIGIYQRKK